MSDGVTINAHHGVGAVSTWDQIHAGALDELRGCDGFILLTVKDGKLRTPAACSNGLAPSQMRWLLLQGALAMASMAEALEDAA